MKKALIFILIISALVACSKNDSRLTDQTPTAQYYFSHVRYYKDNRMPSNDTVWTLTMMNQIMVDSFRKWDGYVYTDASYYKEIGRLWHK